MKNRNLIYKDCWYPEDVKRLGKICLENGLFISPYDLQDAWERYSDSMCASWLIMGGYTDDEIFDNIKEYL